jgi:hypothetical protein
MPYIGFRGLRILLSNAVSSNHSNQTPVLATLLPAILVNIRPLPLQMQHSLRILRTKILHWSLRISCFSWYPLCSRMLVQEIGTRQTKCSVRNLRYAGADVLGILAICIVFWYARKRRLERLDGMQISIHLLPTPRSDRCISGCLSLTLFPPYLLPSMEL